MATEDKQLKNGQKQSKDEKGLEKHNKELARQISNLKKENEELKVQLSEALNKELRGRRTLDFFAEFFETQVNQQQAMMERVSEVRSSPDEVGRVSDE